MLTEPSALETVGGNHVFNRFDIPQLRGVNRTAPYFHDHRAQTLEEVMHHYQRFFAFINEVRGFPLPKIPDEDVEPIVAYMRKALSRGRRGRNSRTLPTLTPATEPLFTGSFPPESGEFRAHENNDAR